MTMELTTIEYRSSGDTHEQSVLRKRAIKMFRSATTNLTGKGPSRFALINEEQMQKGLLTSSDSDIKDSLQEYRGHSKH